MSDLTQNPSLNLDYELTKEQQLILSTVLKEYLNVRDWKELFTQTDSEVFAQQHTQFYDDESWDTGSIEDSLEKDCAESVAFILNKDSQNLKVIWEMPGVKTMAQRKNESFHAEIEALFESQIESVDNQIAATSDNNTDSNHPDENQNPYETLEAAERLLDSNRTKEAFGLMHAALRKFLQQTCTNKEIATDKNDSISILQAKIIDHIKQQNNANLTDTSCSMLRTATLMTETIGDISHQYRDEEHFNNADIKYAINITRSVMIYIDELIS